MANTRRSGRPVLPTKEAARVRAGIRHLIAHYGSVAAVAAALSKLGPAVSRVTLSAVEREKTAPTAEVAAAVARGFGFDGFEPFVALSVTQIGETVIDRAAGGAS